MSYRWIYIESEIIFFFNFGKLLKNEKKCYIGASIRPVFHALLKTISAPPKSILPLTATSSKAPNIENV